MAIGYVKKDEATLAWMENRDTVTFQARQLMRRVINEALGELDVEFKAALERGEIIEINPGLNELKALLLKTAQKELS